MNSGDLCRELREILPRGVQVAAGPALATPLTANESASLGAVDGNRACEFASGRAYAKRALLMLGVRDVDLPTGPNGSPRWPCGIVGSISHTRCSDGHLHVAAAVARADAVSALGIDIEAADGLGPDVWSHVLTEREFERLLASPIETRRIEAQHVWCAKEAATKAMEKVFDPSAVEVTRDPRSGNFVVSFADGHKWLENSFLGRTARLNELFLATAALLPTPH
jgi:4'-phosphopantetheinyl transferase EntD